MADDVAPRTAINQSPGGGTDYPFLRESPLAGIVLDVYVHCAPGTFRLPFLLTTGTGPPDVFIVYDADGSEIANCATGEGEYTSTAWGSRTVHMWTTATFVFRVVVATPMLVSGDVELDPRTFHAIVPGVDAIVANGDTLTGDVTLRDGYNTSVIANNVIGISAVPGSGRGRSPGCQDPTPLLRQINRVAGDAQKNFTLSFDPCFRAQRPLAFSDAALPVATFPTDDDAHTVQLADDCRPCMTCDDVVRTYKGLRRIWERWRAAAAGAETVRDAYAANRQRWIDGRNCRLAAPSTLTMSPDYGCRAFAGGAFSNVTACCVRNVELRFTLQRYFGGVPAAWSGGAVTSATRNGDAYSPIAAGAVIRFFFDAVDPNQTAAVTFKYALAGCTPGTSLVATLTVHADDPGTDPLGGACPLPSAAVPGGILAIWSAYGVPNRAARTLQTGAAGVSP